MKITEDAVCEKVKAMFFCENVKKLCHAMDAMNMIQCMLLPASENATGI